MTEPFGGQCDICKEYKGMNVVLKWFIGFNFRRKIQNERKIFY
jgi:hypothetical protein